MATSINEYTHKLMKSAPSTKEYNDGWDRIFGKKLCPSCGKEVDKNAYDTVEHDGSFWHEGCWEWEATNLGNVGVSVKDEQEKIIPLVRMPSGKFGINAPRMFL